MPTRERKEQAAAVAAGSIKPRPRGKAPQDYPHWDESLGAWKNDAGEVRLTRREAAQQRQRQRDRSDRNRDGPDETDNERRARQRSKSAAQRQAHAAREAARHAAKAAQLQERWASIVTDYANNCAQDPGYCQDINKYLEVDDRYMVRDRRQGSTGFEYSVEWITDECETIAKVWVPHEHLLAHQKRLDEIDARIDTGKSKRRPPIGSYYVAPTLVSTRAIEALMGELRLNGYQEEREQYTDESDAAYQDSD